MTLGAGGLRQPGYARHSTNLPLDRHKGLSIRPTSSSLIRANEGKAPLTFLASDVGGTRAPDDTPFFSGFRPPGARSRHWSRVAAEIQRGTDSVGNQAAPRLRILGRRY